MELEDPNKPIMEGKGKLNGRCNRQACQSSDDVTWYNSSTREHYCKQCAAAINKYNPGLCVHVLVLPLPKAHEDWYDDGDDGTDENLWRLDLEHVQIQVFMNVTPDGLMTTGPTSGRIWIEYDRRDPADPDNRWAYVGKDVGHVSDYVTSALVTGNRNYVENVLRRELKELRVEGDQTSYTDIEPKRRHNPRNIQNPEIRTPA